MPQRAMTVIVRSDLEANRLSGPTREQIRALDLDVPIFDLRTMNAAVAESIGRRRFSAWLLVVFAVMALSLAACGLYAVASYQVARTEHEIGIRLALGASPAAIVRMIVGQGLAAAFIGLALGAPAALFLMRYVRGLLFGVTTDDPPTYVAVALLLVATCLAACYLPARRATRIDPLSALRSE